MRSILIFFFLIVPLSVWILTQTWYWVILASLMIAGLILILIFSLAEKNENKIINFLITIGAYNKAMKMAQKLYVFKNDTQSSIHALKKLASKGHLQSKFTLATFYIEGKGIEKNVKQGIKLLEENVNSGHGESCALLGFYYLYEKYGVFKKDCDKAAKYYELAAHKGSAVSQRSYAELLDGWDSSTDSISKNPPCPKIIDHKQALYWYEQSIINGNETTNWLLAKKYCSGEGVPIDYKKAIQYANKLKNNYSWQHHIDKLWTEYNLAKYE